MALLRLNCILELSGIIKHISIFYFYITMLMPTWNCNNCNMPMTLLDKIPNVSCPNCGKKMIEISD